jgi:hypothetical protein
MGGKPQIVQEGIKSGNVSSSRSRRAVKPAYGYRR